MFFREHPQTGDADPGIEEMSRASQDHRLGRRAAIDDPLEVVRNFQRARRADGGARHAAAAPISVDPDDSVQINGAVNASVKTTGTATCMESGPETAGDGQAGKIFPFPVAHEVRGFAVSHDAPDGRSRNSRSQAT